VAGLDLIRLLASSGSWPLASSFQDAAVRENQDQTLPGI